MPDPWPLRHLVIRTPRLTLRPDDDEGLHELAALALRGVHPPEKMPGTRLVLEPSHFVRPEWTLRTDGLDGCRELLGAGSLPAGYSSLT